MTSPKIFCHTNINNAVVEMFTNWPQHGQLYTYCQDKHGRWWSIHVGAVVTSLRDNQMFKRQFLSPLFLVYFALNRSFC